MEKQLWRLLFGVRRSVRYHNCRRLHFERLSNISTFISLFFGSATVVSLVTTGGRAFPIAASALVAISSTLNIVFSPSRRARDHSDLAKRFVSLEKDIVGVSNPTDEQIREWTQLRLEIEKDEPPILQVIDVICHNDQMRAMGYDPGQFVHITRSQRLFAHYKDISAHKITKRQPPPTL